VSNLVLLILCFLLGILFRHIDRFPKNTPEVLNAFILYVSLPALVLMHIHEVNITYEILLPALMPWMIFFIAVLIFYSLYYFKIFEIKTAICLILTAGLGNTSFVGIPLLESYLGKDAIGYAIISDQMGTFFVLSFPGLILASISESGKWSLSALLKRVFTFPPVIALIIAILLRPFDYPSWLTTVLVRLGDTLTPLALVSVGFLLNLRTLKGHSFALGIGLSVKLILLPMIVAFVYHFITPNQLMYKTIVMEAAMAPMVTSTIVAIDRNIAPHLASLMLGIGIPLSFLTTYIFFNILEVGFL